MKNIGKIVLWVVLGAIVVWTFYFLYQKSQKPPVEYQIASASYGPVVSKTVATGSVVPRREIEIKPQVSGIIDELFVESGDQVEVGQVVARIKIIPDMVQLNTSETRVNQSKIRLEDARLDYERQKELFEKEVISKSEFQKALTTYDSAREELEAAQNNLQLVKEGVTKKFASATNTLIRATIDGMVLDVPVRKGNSVIQANTFNAGTTIAVVADMKDMIFEGTIDETEVGKIKPGMNLHLTIGAIEDLKFDAILKYIAPKGKEENGAIQFEIKADVLLKDDVFVRAGYSANADIVLQKLDSVMVIDESLVQFEGDTAYVEVLIENDEEGQQFERRNIKTGLSDGIKIEVKSGVSLEDKLKGERKVDVKDKKKPNAN